MHQIFLPVFINSIALPIVDNYLLPINTRKAFWFAITCALTYEYNNYGAIRNDAWPIAYGNNFPYTYVVLLRCNMLGVISAIIPMADSFI